VPAAGQPIGAAERDRLLSHVRLPVAIAVSGGADSTALMHLVAGWAKERGRAATVSPGVPPVLVITVDHGLRPESASEAEWVAQQAEGLGLAHKSLRWTGPKPRTGIQEAARAARYSLILEELGREPLPEPRQLLIAHHLDDQAETVLMRLARGSGVDGLSGMREVERRTWLKLGHPVEERTIEILRPLLGVPRSRLEATLKAAGAEWLDDPSNADVRYERVRLRAATREREALGLGPDMLALSARRVAAARAALETAAYELARAERVRLRAAMRERQALGLAPDMLALSARRVAAARAALETAAYELARAAVDLHQGAWASIDPAALNHAPREVALRLLQSVIGAFGGQPELPVRSQMEDLVERLFSPNPSTTTLGGVVIDPALSLRSAPSQKTTVIAIYREPGRRPLPKVTLEPGQGLFWDRRFYLSVAPEFGQSVRVEALGQAGFAALKRSHPSLRQLPIPSRAAATLPGLWAGDRLLAVPCLSVVEPSLAGPTANDGRLLLEARFALQHARSILGDGVRDDNLT